VAGHRRTSSEDNPAIGALLQSPDPTTAATEDYTPLRPRTPVRDDASVKHIADRHLANYFATIHSLIPVLHEGAFRTLYYNFWSQVNTQAQSPRTDTHSRKLQKITAPLVYSVLALGALYESGYNDHVYWAREWFGKARDGINNAIEECCFEMCLAVYFVVRPLQIPSDVKASYCQHVIKPNLAYNHLGLAIRLAYSVGLNRSSGVVPTPEAWPGVSRAVVTEMCKRFWWQMYTLEVEIALDSGRPICIRNSDIDVEWPLEVDDDVWLESDKC